MGEGVEWVLSERGLSTREAKLYLCLAKNGPQKAIEISRNLKIHKVEIYRLLNCLENRGLAESTLERPRRFVALPFEQVVDSLISERKKTTTVLEDRKNELLNQWNLMQTDKPQDTTERFAALSGRENVYHKIIQLLQNSRGEIVATTARLDIVRADHDGFLSQALPKVAEKCRTTDLHARFLTQLTRENFEAIRDLTRSLMEQGLRVDMRRLSPDVKFVPRIAVRDGEEAVAFLTPSGIPISSQEETGFWTNSKTVVCALQALFEELWRGSTAFPEVVAELEELR